MKNVENNNIEIVCVANNSETFNKVIATNQHINKYPMTMFDNSIENIGISKRYNSYIEKKIDENSDFWVIFCHQDFGFKEDPFTKINKLDNKFLYGAVGVKTYFSLKRGLKGIFSQKTGYYPSYRLLVKGIFSKDIKTFNVERQEPTSGFIKRKILGQIQQGHNNDRFNKFGKRIFFPKDVSTLDCCCMMVHSSLISKYNLRFDENLDWHMYVEEFCINSAKTYGIKSKAVQFDCYHLGIGNLNDDFYKCANYVKEKHSMDSLKTTCIDD